MRCEQVVHISEEQDNTAGAVGGKFRPQVTESQLHVVTPGPTRGGGTMCAHGGP